MDVRAHVHPQTPVCVRATALVQRRDQMDPGVPAPPSAGFELHESDQVSGSKQIKAGRSWFQKIFDSAKVILVKLESKFLDGFIRLIFFDFFLYFL